MKLYATTTSERATKGQGGNEYIKVILRDEKQQCFAYITVKPNKMLFVDYIKEWNANINPCEWIGTDDDIKGKSQKGEKHVPKYCIGYEKSQYDSLCKNCGINKNFHNY